MGQCRPVISLWVALKVKMWNHHQRRQMKWAHRLVLTYAPTSLHKRTPLHLM